jgi:hypothetical protein
LTCNAAPQRDSQSIDNFFGSIPALTQISDDFDDEIEEAIEEALRDYGR